MLGKLRRQEMSLYLSTEYEWLIQRNLYLHPLGMCFHDSLSDTTTRTPLSSSLHLFFSSTVAPEIRNMGSVHRKQVQKSIKSAWLNVVLTVNPVSSIYCCQSLIYAEMFASTRHVS